MEKESYPLKSKEKEPKRIIVEIGPGDRPVIWRLSGNDKELKYRAGGETLFSIRPGDVFFEVDLPPERSVDVFRRQIRVHGQEGVWREGGKLKSHLKTIEEELDRHLPKGAKGAVLHAEGQKLPFSDGQIDTLFMANVFGGHVKDDKMLGFKAGGQRILREKRNLIREARRVLKVGGKLIIEEEYAPAENVKSALGMVVNDLEHDPNFSFRDLTDENGVFTLELTKK